MGGEGGLARRNRRSFQSGGWLSQKRRYLPQLVLVLTANGFVVTETAQQFFQAVSPALT